MTYRLGNIMRLADALGKLDMEYLRGYEKFNALMEELTIFAGEPGYVDEVLKAIAALIDEAYEKTEKP